MGYRLKNKDINIGRLPIINYSSTGNVYKLNSGIALKIFKENLDLINEEEAAYLSEVRCDRILMPKNPLYYDDKFVGYSSNLLHEKKRLQRISMIEKDDLIAHVELLEDDIDNLSKKKVLLDGISPNNLVYCDGIYIPDVSQFKVLKDDIYSAESFKAFNYYELFLLISNLIINDLNKDKYDDKMIENFIELLNLKDDNERTSEYLDDILEGSNNIRQFVKKM